MQQDSPELQQDVITLRLSFLSRSGTFRADVVARLANEEDPFDMKEYNLAKVDLGNVAIDIVRQDKEDFAAALDSLIEEGTGDEYLEQVDQITAPGLRDTHDNREHIWDYWKGAADADGALRPKKREFDEFALNQGTEVHFVGGYQGTGPDIELGEDGFGHPEMRFTNTPGTWWKLNP